MAQYINKAAVTAEIEKLQERFTRIRTCNEHEDDIRQGRLIGYLDALDKLNSVEVKEEKQKLESFSTEELKAEIQRRAEIAQIKYEQRYKEAFERAKDVYIYYCDDREQLRKIEHIFPELKKIEI